MNDTSSNIQTAAPTPHKIRGPLVWLDMDQKELDDAYDQSVYAPNQKLLALRRAAASQGDPGASRRAHARRLWSRVKSKNSTSTKPRAPMRP